MSDNLLKRDNEKYSQYIKRLVDGKLNDKTLSDYDHSEIYKTIYGVDVNSSEARKRLYGLRDYFKITENENIEDITVSDKIKEMEEKRRELEVERKKIQAVKVEYHKDNREQAKKELIYEYVENAINNLEPFDIPEPIIISEGYKEGILPISDPHFGKKCEIRGLKGELLNEYNEDVFERRMIQLLNRAVSISEKEGISKLNITLQGDLIDGILRMSQLTKIQYGVIDSTMKFADFIANWLNELSKKVYCNVFYTLGNHSQIRPLGSKNGEFSDENMEKIIIWHIKTRLENNPNVTINDNNSDFIFFNCLGINVMGSHGEERNLEQAVKDYKMIYGEDIHLFLAGHLHSKETKSIGINGDLSDIETIRVKSICGIDDFSMRLRRSASAGATYLVIEEGQGKTIEYDIKLK